MAIVRSARLTTCCLFLFLGCTNGCENKAVEDKPSEEKQATTEADSAGQQVVEPITTEGSALDERTLRDRAAAERLNAEREASTRAVRPHSNAFDARLEADVLVRYWGPDAEVRRMLPDDYAAFAVNIDTGGRSLTSRFLETSPVEVDFFSGDAKAEEVERLRHYLKKRYPRAEWRPAVGHLLGGGEEQWRIFPEAETAGYLPDIAPPGLLTAVTLSGEQSPPLPLK